MQALSILASELEARGYKVSRYGMAIEASTKTDALRFTRSLIKLLSSGQVLKGLNYVAMFGIAELVKIRAFGKKMSPTQKAAVVLTLNQMRKSGVFKRFCDKLRNKLHFKSKDQRVEEDMQELTEFLNSDEGLGEIEQPGTEEYEEGHEPPKRSTGWAPAARRDEENRAYYGEEKAARLRKRLPRFDPATASIIAAAVNPAQAAEVLKLAESLRHDKSARGATLISLYGVYGILKQSIKAHCFSTIDQAALDVTFTYLLRSPKAPTSIKSKLSELRDAYTELV
jgi:hypothetical protein